MSRQEISSDLGLTDLPPGDDFAPDAHGRTLTDFSFDDGLSEMGAADEPLCIQIHEDARKEDVIALLRRAADELEQDFYQYMIPENQERYWQAMRDQLEQEDRNDPPAKDDE
ncbi:MAG: hypothetical protein ABI700_00420 [Chloroflexota bacterium]